MLTISLPCPMCPQAQIEQGMLACPNCGWQVTDEFTMRLISKARDTHMRAAPAGGAPGPGTHTGTAAFGNPHAPSGGGAGFGTAAPPPGFANPAPPPGGGTGFRGGGGQLLPGGITPGLGDQPITQMRQRQQSTARLRVTAETEGKIKRAVVVMVILAVLFGIVGYIEITQVQNQVRTSKAEIQSAVIEGLVSEDIAAEEVTRINLILTVVMAIDIGLVIAFIVLAIWTRFQPLPPTIIALLLYGGVLVAQYNFIGPEALSRGVIFKILIIAALISGIGAAADYTRAKAAYKRELARQQFG